MNDRGEFRICRLRSTRTGRQYDVLVWPGYGVVVPGLWTTNGSVRYAAELISGYAQAGSYEIVDSVEPLSVDFVELRRQLTDIYEQQKGRGR
jgi:hypothetical protein